MPLESGGNIEGIILLSVLVSVPISVVLSVFILKKYVVSISRLMKMSGGKQPSEGEWKRNTLLMTKVPAGITEYNTRLPTSLLSLPKEIVSNSIKTAIIYSIAGVLYTICMSLLYSAFESEFLTFKQNAVLWAMMSLPVIPLAIVILFQSNKKRLVVFISIIIPYIVILSVIVPFMELLRSLAIFNGIPFLVFLSFSNRKIRAAGILVLSIVALVTVILGFMFDFALRVLVSFRIYSHGGIFIVAILGLGLFCLVILGLRLIMKKYAELYINKQTSDQILYINTWWLSLTIWHTLTLMSSVKNVQAGLLGITTFFLFMVVCKFGFTLRKKKHLPGYSLLFLRVFGHGKRSEEFLSAFSHSWRSVGAIQMIAGADLVRTNLEPHELLTFLSGHLRDEYTHNEDELKARLNRLDLLPDPDGRYRINEFFCFDDTWRNTASALIKRCDFVIMDARGLNESNSGCLYELEVLMQNLSTDRFLLIVDETTDMNLLCSTAANLSNDSVNIPVFTMKKKGACEVDKIVEVCWQRCSAH